MQSSSSPRPYRSHSRPACTACRRRKSRCKVEANATMCIMCSVHGTPCEFRSKSVTPRSPTTARRRFTVAATSTPTPTQTIISSTNGSALAAYPVVQYAECPLTAQPTPGRPEGDQKRNEEAPLLSLDALDGDENPHIVGPVVTNDNHVLADYLSSIHAEGMRITRTAPASTPSGRGSTDAVLFTHVQKRPLGMTIRPNVSSLNLQMIEKLLEPWRNRLVEVYLAKVNMCFPLVDEASFRNQYTNARHPVSPALLASLYAHTLTFWMYDKELSAERKPDCRFVWNLASEALYAELYAAPGLATVTAILLNVGGRPTTSMIGNGVLLGAAVALSHSLGLNRNPLAWDIPQAEKYLRMKIWWCLLVHDRWSSLAHGTPPHIRRAHYDVPLPTEMCLYSPDTVSSISRDSSGIFIALVSLTEILARCLDHVFDLERNSQRTPQSGSGPRRSQLTFDLNAWVESLPDDVRHIVVRGTQLATPGASNLRLAYLSVRLLLERIGLNEDKAAASTDVEETIRLGNRYMEIRRSAEEIVRLVQELDHQQLGDFWLPVVSFTFTHTVAFLARCALEENSHGDDGSLAESPSLHMATRLLDALRQHEAHSNWDLANLCLSQHGDVIQRLLTTSRPHEEQPIELPPSLGPPYGMYSGSFVDSLFSGIWDTL